MLGCMKPRIALALLALGLALAGIYLVFASESGMRPRSAERPAEAAPAAREPAEILTAEPLAAAEERGLAGEMRRAPAAAETRAAAPAAAPEGGPTFLVRVVDERGLPRADVPVELRLEHGGGTSSVLGRTRGDEGLATFRRVGEGWGLDLERCSATASIAGVFERPIERTYPFREWPQAPVELVLPAHGSVVVLLLDAAGDALPDPRREVELAIAREQQPGASLWNAAGTSSTEVEGGRARFGFVGLGLELEATFDGRPERGRASTTLRGPTRPGEEVSVQLICRGPASELLFRALDPGGTPLAERELELSLVRRIGGGSLSTGESRTTDAGGRVRIALLEPWSAGSTLTLELTCRVSAGDTLAAELDLSREFPPGTTDLGDVVLAPAPMLVSGRIVDASERPVTGASVRVERAYTQGPGAEPTWNTALWGNVEQDGSFVFREAPPAPELRLVVDSSEHLRPAPIPFVPGTRDLEIVLVAGGALAGSIRVPEGVPASAFQLRASIPGHGPRTAFVEPDGSFVVRGLPAGSVDCAFLILAGSQELLEVQGVTVVDGETRRDPRLQEVDLAEGVRKLAVGVLLPDGSPAQSGWVRTLGQERPGQTPAAFVIENGAAHVLGRRAPLDLEINVPGFRIVRLAGVERDQQVRLEPAFAVRLVLPADVPLPPAGSSLQVGLERQDEGGTSAPGHLNLFRHGQSVGWWSPAFGDESNTFGEGREVLVTVQEPGRYEVRFHVVHGSPDGGRMSFNIPASEATRYLELDERAAGAGYRVEPDRKQYEQRL
jgi:hypothetical protein